jgi:hypothetical protein
MDLQLNEKYQDKFNKISFEQLGPDLSDMLGVSLCDL